jgi:kynurenine formamidase
VTQTQTLAGLLARATYYDVSPTIHVGMPGVRVHPQLAIDAQARNHAEHGYFVQALSMSEHTGAHVDAPAHILADRMDETIDRVPAQALIAPYKKYDLSALDLTPGRLVTAAELRAVEERDDFALDAGDVAIVQYGWDRYYRPQSADEDERMWWIDNAPGLAADACQYLVDAAVRAVASDTATADTAMVDGAITSDVGHTTYFLPNGILLVESLVGLAAAPARGVFLALPLKINGGSGSPIRAVLVVEEDA